MAPAATARVLVKGALGPAEQAAAQVLAQSAKAAFADRGARTVMVAREGRVLLADSAWHVPGNATPLGFSMSKSLTSMAVGKAFCNGRIQSLDDPIGKYVPRLADTSWGRASVRQALRMTTGATWTLPSGWRDRATSEQHGGTYDGYMSADYVSLMLEADVKVGAPGSLFRYSNYDSLALALLVEQATGMPFPEFFGREIWSQAGTSGEGAWLRNRAGQTVSYAGFSAAPADWVRLALYTLDALAQDSCFGKYMREATSKQVDADFFSYGYGYQVWTDCASGTDAFCFYGYGGQLLIMSPKHRLVLYAHSVSHSVDHHWREAFAAAWAKLEEGVPR